ncbi:MAG TPA: GMC family oxidoreductase [Frankiaceae bacterium]
MAVTLTPTQRATLRALADTAVPGLPAPEGVTDPAVVAFWETSASDVGVDVAIEEFLGTLPDADAAGVAQLLDAMAMLGLQYQGRHTREAILKSVAALGPEALVGVGQLRSLACMFAQIVHTDGRNPLWAGYRYAGPEPVRRAAAARTAEAEAAGELPVTTPAAGEVLQADVVIVGSGAGGGTIAGVLAAAGRSVIVVEAAAASRASDHVGLEADGNARMLYRGGLTGTVDGNMSMLAGSTLGGGTAVNWSNCVLPAQHVRDEWAAAGLTDMPTDFDRHLEAVLARMGATDACSDFNGPHQRLAEGAEKLGWHFHKATLNLDPQHYDPELAGYVQFGDSNGARRGTLATYLVDAVEHGARILVHTAVRTVTVENGRASGVEAFITDPATGATRPLTIRAQDVVLAAGALETPAILLRSGIGGPAAGQHLHLHPSVSILAKYAEPQDPWWGPPQAAVVDEFGALDGGWGFLIEGSVFYPGLLAYGTPGRDGAEHKELMAQLDHMSNLLFILRDRSAGHVELDESGEAAHYYQLDDPRDLAVFHKGIRALAELHLAAGALELRLNSPIVPPFDAGEDLDAWLAGIEQIPVIAGGIGLGSAHQMGTARMGTDPATSVAKPSGELHDVAGVWIGDTSAFPSPSGANPMLSCMALAHRTAEHIAGQRDVPAPAQREAAADVLAALPTA